MKRDIQEVGITVLVEGRCERSRPHTSVFATCSTPVPNGALVPIPGWDHLLSIEIQESACKYIFLIIFL